MNSDKLTPVKDPSDVPSGMSEEEEVEFWRTHSITEEYLNKRKASSESTPPKKRSRAISVRFEEDLLRRLKDVADIQGTPYQTLLKEFVTKQLHKEEASELESVGGWSGSADRDQTLERFLQALERYGPTLVTVLEKLEKYEPVLVEALGMLERHESASEGTHELILEEAHAPIEEIAGAPLDSREFVMRPAAADSHYPVDHFQREVDNKLDEILARRINSKLSQIEAASSSAVPQHHHRMVPTTGPSPRGLRQPDRRTLESSSVVKEVSLHVNETNQRI